MKPKKTAHLNSSRARGIILSASIISVCCSTGWADDWTGTTSSDWNEATNWSGSAVPNGAAAAIGTATGNIATISSTVIAAPSEIVIGGWFSTGRVDHTGGTLSTINMGWPPGWMLVGFGPTGNGTYNLADTSTTGGTYTGFGTGDGTINIVDALFLGEPGGSNDGTGIATVNVNTTGSMAVTYDMNIGVSGWTGTLNVDAGTVTANNLNVGKSNNGNATAGIGNFNMSGGNVTLRYRLNIGMGDNVVPTGANVGAVTLSGGTLRTDDVETAWWASGVNLASAAWDGVSGSGIGGTGGTATFNLDGGTLVTQWVFSANQVDEMGTPGVPEDDVTYAKGTSTFNFNGGTLQAQDHMDVPWLPFMGNLTNAYVKAGGAIIDSAGFNLLITQPMLGDPVSTGGGLTKNGDGQLEITGQNTFTGDVVVNGGTLFANAGNAPTDRTFSYANSVTVSSGATLRASANSLFGWDGSQAKPITVEAGGTAIAEDSDQNVGLVTLNGGTLASVNAAVDWGSWNFGRGAAKQLHVTDDSIVTAAGVGLVNGASIDVDATKTLTFTGTITDKPDAISTLIKLGDGTLILSGANTYTGATEVNAGTVTMDSAILADTADVSLGVTSGAILNLNHNETDTILGLYIDGSPVTPGLYRATDVNGGSGEGTPIEGLTGTGKLEVTSEPPAGGYGDWAGTNAGGAAADVDTDLDGVSNGVEYFMNAAAEFTANPGPDGTKTVTWPNGGNIPAADYGTQFVVQTSTNLVDWSDVPVGSLAGNTDGPGGAVSFTITGADKQFVRLKVTPN